MYLYIIQKNIYPIYSEYISFKSRSYIILIYIEWINLFDIENFDNWFFESDSNNNNDKSNPDSSRCISSTTKKLNINKIYDVPKKNMNSLKICHAVAFVATY